jgi:hypothetical protein
MWHAGDIYADFDKLDDDNTICQSINQRAIEWALSKSN